MNTLLRGRLGGRIGRNLSAQLYSQGVTLVIQFATIPLLIVAWGIETYGVWLLLTALPAYLTLSDFGFTFVAKNAMSMQVAGNDRAGAVETFQSIFALLLALVAGIGAPVLILAWTAPLDALFQLAGTSLQAARTALSAQILTVLSYQLFLLFCSGLRADGRAATETAFAASSRLCEAVAICLAALAGADIAWAALAGLAARLVCLALLVVYVRVNVSWLPIGLGKASAARLRALLSPSLGYMLVPVANALLIQGPIVLIGAVAGPASVALFSVTRTVARLGMAGANMLNFAFTPEYSFAFGRRDLAMLRAHLKLHALLIGAGILAYAAVMAALAGPAVDLLSHGRIAPLAWLTAAMAAAVGLEMAWSFFFTPLAALNAHARAALLFATVSAILLALAAMQPTLPVIAAALAAVHAVMLAACVLLFARFHRRHLAETKLPVPS